MLAYENDVYKIMHPDTVLEDMYVFRDLAHGDPLRIKF